MPAERFDYNTVPEERDTVTGLPRTGCGVLYDIFFISFSKVYLSDFSLNIFGFVVHFHFPD